MSKTLTKPSLNNFRDRVLSIVRAIPRGRVLTYGQVATLAGVPRAARIVGSILFQCGPGSRIPWQRVLNARGGLSTYRLGFGEKQKILLKMEGVVFGRHQSIDLPEYQWKPNLKTLKKLGAFRDLPKEIYDKLWV